MGIILFFRRWMKWLTRLCPTRSNWSATLTSSRPMVKKINFIYPLTTIFLFRLIKLIIQICIIFLHSRVRPDGAHQKHRREEQNLALVHRNGIPQLLHAAHHHEEHLWESWMVKCTFPLIKNPPILMPRKSILFGYN